VIDLEVHERPREIEPGFQVGRVLPVLQRMHVGPFVFMDHMGPVAHGPGQGVDVRPHPHIGLATVTYLYEGEVLHRDSLGSEQRIRPGEVNWMTAGEGIVHSERLPPEVRVRGGRAHGVQLWVGLPRAAEHGPPRFEHHAALPVAPAGPGSVRVLAGEGFGVRAPVDMGWPVFLADATLPAGAELRVPALPESAAFVASGEVTCEGRRATVGTLFAFTAKSDALLRAERPSRVLLLGGEPLDGPRFIWWNFVSSDKERIVEAARAWRAGRFPKVPGDEVEFVPLDTEPRFAQSPT
jgi:redox-sensitive bicupin YhaK (pirin superfamily)